MNATLIALVLCAQTAADPQPATTPPASETPAAATPADPAAPAQPADPNAPPAPDATTPPATDQADIPAIAPPVTPPPAAMLTPAAAERAPLPTRLLMDSVSGVAGAAVILVAGLGVAVPIALLPWVLQPFLGPVAFFGIPASIFISGALVLGVLIAAVAGSAVIQRLVRPLLGSQPSILGPVLGAVFFGSVGAAIGLVASYLLVTATLEPISSIRNGLIGPWSSTDGRSLAITGALVVAMAIPFAAIGAGVGGPISAEVEDSRAVEASAAAQSAGVSLNPRQQN
jgi:hypothetical protein